MDEVYALLGGARRCGPPALTAAQQNDLDRLLAAGPPRLVSLVAQLQRETRLLRETLRSCTEVVERARAQLVHLGGLKRREVAPDVPTGKRTRFA